MQGNGSTVGYGTDNRINDGFANDATTTSNTFASSEVYIPNYTSTTSKSISTDNVTETNGTTILANLIAARYATSSAITQMQIVLPYYGASFVQYSTFYLYGIKNQ